jgi:hypothetical protein
MKRRFPRGYRAKQIDKLDARIEKREPAGWDLKIHKMTGMKFHDLRYKVFLARKNGESVTDVTRLYRVSRGFVSKWYSIGRRSDGLKGLAKLSFLALPMRHRFNSPVQDRIRKDVMNIREEHPWMGSCKIKVFGKIASSPRTIDKVLRKHGLMGKFRKRKKKTYVRFEREHSMSLWQLDYKQWKDGSWSIWVLDDHSRMILGLEVTMSPDTATVTGLLDNIIRMFGTPKQLLTDHGTQFTNNRGGDENHKFEKWCKDNKIEHIMGRVAHPETQGKIERSHLSAILETAHIPDVRGIDMRREALLDWMLFYNTERPHQSLGYDVPANVFMRDIKNVESFLNVGVHEVNA